MNQEDYVEMIQIVFPFLEQERIEAHMRSIQYDHSVYTTNTQDSDSIEKYVSNLNVDRAVDGLLK